MAIPGMSFGKRAAAAKEKLPTEVVESPPVEEFAELMPAAENVVEQPVYSREGVLQNPGAVEVSREGVVTVKGG